MHRYRHEAVLFLILWGMVCVIITYAYGLVIWAIEVLFHVEIDQSGGTFRSKFSCFFATCIAAPLIETCLFQKIPYDAFARRKWQNNWLVVCAAFVFGLGHAYNVAYIIITTIKGVVLIYAYITWEGTRVDKFWMVAFIHAFNNIFFFLLQLIFE